VGIPVYLGSRPITLAGTIVAQSRAELEGAMDQLYAAAGLTDTTLTVWEATPKQAVVRRSGKPLMQYLTDTQGHLLRDGDGRRSAPLQHHLQIRTTGLPSTTGRPDLPGHVSVCSRRPRCPGRSTPSTPGPFETRPVLAIAGRSPRPQFRRSIRTARCVQLIYSLDLASGDVLTIDTDAHTVILNGSVSGRRRFLTVPQWLAHHPGGSESVTYQFQSSLQRHATLTATWRSAWM
jgi:hypothetical protein